MDEIIEIEKPREKNPHAVALGKLGGSRGGYARAAALTPERRSEIARAAGSAPKKPRRKKVADPQPDIEKTP